MRVYFSGAIYQKEKFLNSYKRIVGTLEKEEYEVFEDTTKVSLEEAVNKTDEQRVDYYKRVLKWIDKCDLVVIEASFPSTLSIGHEIAISLEKGKSVVIMYQEGFEPAFLLGLKHEKVEWVKYNPNNLEGVLASALKKVKKNIDVRFNFFVSPKILAYLDWVAEKRMIPRSVFLRNLIEKEIRKDKGFRQ